jgi:hypothetical protein
MAICRPGCHKLMVGVRTAIVFVAKGAPFDVVKASRGGSIVSVVVVVAVVVEKSISLK